MIVAAILLDSSVKRLKGLVAIDGAISGFVIAVVVVVRMMMTVAAVIIDVIVIVIVIIGKVVVVDIAGSW